MPRRRRIAELIAGILLGLATGIAVAYLVVIVLAGGRDASSISTTTSPPSPPPHDTTTDRSSGRDAR